MGSLRGPSASKTSRRIPLGEGQLAGDSCSRLPCTIKPAWCMRLAELCGVMHGPPFSLRPIGGRGRDSIDFHVGKQRDEAFSEPGKEFFLHSLFFLDTALSVK